MFEVGKVPVIVRSNMDTAYDGLYVKQRGWGQLITVRGFEKRACEVIAEFKKAY